MRELILSSLLLVSCVDQAYVGRMGEIEAARSSGEITTAQYLSLKNEADQVHEKRYEGGGLIRKWGKDATREASGQ